MDTRRGGGPDRRRDRAPRPGPKGTHRGSGVGGERRKPGRKELRGIPRSQYPGQSPKPLRIPVKPLREILYQADGRFFGQISRGMEELGAAELERLGAHKPVAAYRGVHFEADLPTLYRINYCSRLFSRILAPVARFVCPSTDHLYSAAMGIPWECFLGKDSTFAISANVANSRITHSQFAAYRLKDAIADYFRHHSGSRPSVDTRNPSVWISLHILNDTGVVSLETSGGALHRRGYRADAVEAPMQETLGAAIIQLSEWDGERPLYDPMCGSGTLLGEALMSYCRIPPSYLRKRFGFETMPGFDREAWARVKREADQAMRDLPDGLIFGSDKDPGAVRIACANLSKLPGGTRIRISRREFSKIESLHNTTIICNPPYGVRLGDQRLAAQLAKSFGDFLKQRCTGSTAYVYFGERSLIPALGLRTSFKKQLYNGSLDGRLVKLDLYEGGRRGSDAEAEPA